MRLSSGQPEESRRCAVAVQKRVGPGRKPRKAGRFRSRDARPLHVLKVPEEAWGLTAPRRLVQLSAMDLQPKLSHLAAALREDREKLLSEWLGTLRIGMEKPGAVLTDAELRNHFGDLLEDLCN